jgi:transposase
MQHMPKALDQMNLHLHHVMSDGTGVTGRRILRAIVAGERDPRTLAQYRDYRITSRPDTIVKALEGDYRPAHVFTLTHSLALYDFTPQHIAAGDQDIERVLGTFASLVDLDAPPYPHRQRPIANRQDTSRRLISALICTGSLVGISPQGLAAKP